ncbi:MAG TPA: hypothetical protein VM674_03865 [Candidatus Acidoferrum sp.]|nr:hypothetical protein [Candidatus Acidoferrum sp.]
MPDELIDAISIAGPRGYVEERLQVWEAAGATLLQVSIEARTLADRLRTVEMLADAASVLH